MVGIVLAGGYSRRMKIDKALIQYKGKTLMERALDLLNIPCDKVYISCREGQRKQYNIWADIISDKYPDTGPLGGILSALKDVEESILVIPCDMPHLNHDDINQLKQNRNPDKQGTFYRHRGGIAQPFPGIYEYSALPTIEYNLSQGDLRCQNILTKLETEWVTCDKESWVNWNSPDDIEQ